ncbi:ADYC domain-containing protein [Nannocystis exedens]|uniref:ADYC domain-containing protein n=1 Tax=Nannocystis exedens TaxID=54 RepID=UPI000BCF42B7|nr:ADYC domain-containing protein [Nannocystis exedens]PCC68568.1 hypothetical protein NAEX_01584 [Nannocystis exedens]
MLAVDRLLFVASLSLIAACDPEGLAAAPEEPIQHRCAPSCPPPSGNTKWMGSLHPISPLDTLGNEYRGITVDKLVVSNGQTALGFGAFEGNLWADVMGPNGPTRISGFALDDAVFTLTIDGEQKYLSINTVAAPPGTDSHWLYRLLWDDDGPGPLTHGDACEEYEGSVMAVVHDGLDIDPVTGDVVARPDTLYFACLRGAAGKGVLEDRGFGFRPFELGLTRFELALRFILADYCSDGRSWTEDGMDIYYEDKWNIGAGGGAATEGVWGPNGPLCLGSQLRLHKYAEIACPTTVKPPLCGTAAQTTALYENLGLIWSRNP